MELIAMINIFPKVHSPNKTFNKGKVQQRIFYKESKVIIIVHTESMVN